MEIDEVDVAVDRNTPFPGKNRFVCPHCGAFAEQRWTGVARRIGHVASGYSSSPMPEGWAVASCTSCGDITVWLFERMVHPLTRLGPAPHADMPPSVLALYEEAREVSGISRKSAAGLLRLGLQVLVDDLVPGRGTINDKIGELVKQGLDPRVQKAMDVVRVVGNEAVHPGTIDLDADNDWVPSLFQLTNLIVEQMIGRPKQLDALYGALPAGPRASIAKRDGTAP